MTPSFDLTRQSPQAIREQAFAVKRRGLDEREVRDYLALVAEEVRAIENERAQAHQEVDALREKVSALEQEKASGADDDPISDQAVILFSQAQQVADSLISEAVESARDLMTTARAQQRDVMSKAHQSAEAAAARVAGPDGSVGGYDTPVPELEYVRTYTQVAQVQLRAVLDALAEQVDRLGDVPNLDDHRSTTEDTDHSWRFDAKAVPSGAEQPGRPA